MIYKSGLLLFYYCDKFILTNTVHSFRIPVRSLDTLDALLTVLRYLIIYRFTMELLKPVYLKDKEIQCGQNRISDYDLSIAVSNIINDVKCVQKDRDL